MSNTATETLSVVVEREFLVQHQEVRLELLNLEQHVRHRGGLTDDEQPALLEEEAGETTLERPAVCNERRARRRDLRHVCLRLPGALV